MVIDQAGNKEYSWAVTPITLHWTLDISDGTTINDVQIVTVTGVSTCSGASFTPETSPMQLIQVGQTPFAWTKILLFDDVS